MQDNMEPAVDSRFYVVTHGRSTGVFNGWQVLFSSISNRLKLNHILVGTRLAHWFWAILVPFTGVIPLLSKHRLLGKVFKLLPWPSNWLE